MLVEQNPSLFSFHLLKKKNKKKKLLFFALARHLISGCYEPKSWLPLKHFGHEKGDQRIHWPRIQFMYLTVSI